MPTRTAARPDWCEWTSPWGSTIMKKKACTEKKLREDYRHLEMWFWEERLDARCDQLAWSAYIKPVATMLADRMLADHFVRQNRSNSLGYLDDWQIAYWLWVHGSIFGLLQPVCLTAIYSITSYQFWRFMPYKITQVNSRVQPHIIDYGGYQRLDLRV